MIPDWRSNSSDSFEILARFSSCVISLSSWGSWKFLQSPESLASSPADCLQSFPLVKSPKSIRRLEEYPRFCFVTEHRKMVTLKNYVHNKARPEGCIAKRYIDKECLTFCSMYLDNVETIFNRPKRNNETIAKSCHLSICLYPNRNFGLTIKIKAYEKPNIGIQPIWSCLEEKIIGMK